MTTHPFGPAPNLEQVKKQAKDLLKALRAASSSSLERFRLGHPEFSAASSETAQRARLADAQLVIAREYGFPSWAKLKTYVNNYGEMRALLEAAIEAVNPIGWAGVESLPEFASRGEKLDHLLRRHPELAKIPVDSNGFTLLHRAAWGNSLRLSERLIEAGAGIDARANDLSTPLTMALAAGYGNGPLAAMLADGTKVPLTLRLAAGLGLDSRIDEFFEPGGKLAASAVDDQGSYYDKPKRDWDIDRHRSEILAEALTYAARSDQLPTMRLLLDLGAPIDGEPYYGTSLHWAAFFGKLAAVQFLVQEGADRNKLDCQFGGTPAGWGSQFEHEQVVAFLTQSDETSVV